MEGKCRFRCFRLAATIISKCLCVITPVLCGLRDQTKFIIWVFTGQYRHKRLVKPLTFVFCWLESGYHKQKGSKASISMSIMSKIGSISKEKLLLPIYKEYKDHMHVTNQRPYNLSASCRRAWVLLMSISGGVSRYNLGTSSNWECFCHL